MEYNEVNGNLITLALNGNFDVVVHGCNCCSIMGAGIAPQMARAFYCDNFEMEGWGKTIEKLGNIDFETICLGKETTYRNSYYKNNTNDPELIVVNAYTQFEPGRNLDYNALKLCLIKINALFSGAHVAMPMIGCGIAGGNWQVVKQMIKDTLIDCSKVTIVIYDGK